jgi:RHS repeat-associated protein
MNERDTESGLDYRGARYYDSEYGRFMGIDPLAGQFVGWSPYNYVFGRPTGLSDPGGMSPDGTDPDGMNPGGIVYTAHLPTQTILGNLGLGQFAENDALLAYLTMMTSSANMNAGVVVGVFDFLKEMGFLAFGALYDYKKYYGMPSAIYKKLKEDPSFRWEMAAGMVVKAHKGLKYAKTHNIEATAYEFGYFIGHDIVPALLMEGLSASASAASRVGSMEANMLRKGATEITEEVMETAVTQGDEAMEAVVQNGADDAVEGVGQGADELSGLPLQVHHFATNKHSYFTARMQAIAERYGLTLDGAWNKALMPHRGRHPTVYHEWVLRNMERISLEVGDDTQRFLEMFERDVKQVVLQNPGLLRKSGWQ